MLSLAFAVIMPSSAFADDAAPVTSMNASGVINRPVSVDPTGSNEGYSAVLYDNLSGLPTSEANAIAETAEGFLWIGSYAGLIQYDGNTFVRMDSTTGITSVTCLYVDSSDRLWIGTNANGVAVMERGMFRMWSINEGLGSASVRAITQDKEGVIYVATTSGIAAIDANMQLTPVADPRINNAYIRDIRIGNDGLVYGLTQVGDVFTLKGGTVETFLGYGQSRVSGIIGILPDPERPGYLYLGTESTQVYHGRLENNFEDMAIKDVAPLSYVERFEWIDGKVWICAGNGIGNIDNAGFHLLDNVAMDNSVSHVMTDYEGNLWFTSTRQGVMKVVPNQFTDVFERDNLAESVVNATCMYGNQLFLATDSGLMVVEDGKQLDSLPLTKATTASGDDLGTADLLEFLNGVRIRSIVRDSKGRLWIATWRKHGLIRYDNGEATAFTEEDGLFSDRVRVACERSDGAMMVANTGGVSVIEGDRVTKSYGEDVGIANTEILTVAEGMGKDMLLGTDGGGIYIVNDSGARHIGTAEGLSSEVVMRIKRDKTRDVFWIVTTNSIAYMDADYNVTTVQKFPYPNNFDMYQNSWDDMWILAGNGIYVASVEELLANGDVSPVYYNHDNGLPCTSTANSYSELTDDGDLYIAGSTGVAKVNIEQPFSDVADLKVAVAYVDADGTRIYPDETGLFTVPSATNKLTVNSFVYNYSLVNPTVSYQLAGFEDESAPISRSDLVPVDYTNLPGGSYDFVIRLTDSMNRSSKEATVKIVKEKAFFEEPAFFIIIGLLTAAVIGVLVRIYVSRRTRALERKNRENMELVSEITEAFAKVIDMKDTYTNGHSSRVAKYTVMLARELGYDEETVERYYRIALLHDIGKVGVRAEVLNKPGKLTDEEFEAIKSHTTQGYEVLKDISIMPELSIGAQSHHERPDGNGYPNGLKGDEIPRVAQIIAVADCFDAMYSNRPYRNRMNFDKVVSIITEVSGTQLTPDVVDAFLRLVERGEFRDPNDHGGGTTENIENIRAKADAEAAKAAEAAAAAEADEAAEAAEAAAAVAEIAEPSETADAADTAE